MEKTYYKLRDTGTSFYDASQSKGVVAHRIEALELTDDVQQALRERRLIVVEDANEIKEKLALQESELATNEENAKRVKDEQADKKSDTKAEDKNKEKLAAAAANKLKGLQGQYKKVFNQDAGVLTAEEIEAALAEKKNKDKQDAAALKGLQAEYKSVFKADASSKLTADELREAITKKKAENPLSGI